MLYLRVEYLYEMHMNNFNKKKTDSHLMEYWTWTKCGLFMHVVKYERKKPSFVYYGKFSRAMIIDSLNQ